MQVLLKIQTGELRLMDEGDFENIITYKDINSYEILGYLYSANRAETLVMPKIAEEKLRQMFRDNSDCYTEKSLSNTGENFVNEQALTEDGFIKLLNKLSNFTA